MQICNPSKPEEFENAIDEKTKCIYAETLPDQIECFPY